MAATPREEKSVSTLDLYDEWAETYDTDNNILQGVDSQEFPRLLKLIFADLAKQTATAPRDVILLDYGCGTCRNTATVLRTKLWPRITAIHATDPSSGMLARAKANLGGLQADPQAPPVIFTQLPQATTPSTTSASSEPQPQQQLQLPPSLSPNTATILTATLILEHLPDLAAFFTLCRAALRPGGYALLTNMHSEMGAVSQAGFLDGKTGTKVKGVSFAHAEGEICERAREAGFVVLGDGRGCAEGARGDGGGDDDAGERNGDGDGEGLESGLRTACVGGGWERGVGEGDLEGLGPRARKWLGCKVWFGVVLKKVG